MMYERDSDCHSRPHPYQRPPQSSTQTPRARQEELPGARSEQIETPVSRPQRNAAPGATPRQTAPSIPRSHESAAQRCIASPNEDVRSFFDDTPRGEFTIPRNYFTSRDLSKRGRDHTERPPREGHSVTFSHAIDFGLASQPSDASSHAEPDTPSEGRGLDAKVPKNSIGIGIETEFFLKARGEPQDRDPRRRRQAAPGFCRDVKDLYNEQVPLNFPRMESIYERDCIRWPTDRHDKWVLMRDSTMCTDRPPCNDHPSFWNQGDY